MASKVGGDDDLPIADINIVPFVDIILVVLIIFMVTTPLILKPSIDINLPKAVSGDETTPSQINIAIQKDGQALLNGEAADDAKISEYVKQMSTSKPDIQAIISADKDVAHGSVIHVIDLVKSNGVTKFAITIDKEKK